MEQDEPKARPRESGIAAFAIGRPYLIIVLCLFVLVLGLLSISALPKDLLPVSHAPAVQILSFYAGMPVHDVQMNLTERFERYTGQAIGIERQESKSLVGVSIVKNFFGEGADLNTAISQTTSLVLSVLRRLPPGTQPPLILPFDPMASVPLALIAVGGAKSPKDLYDTARYDVRNEVQAIPGAMAPTVMGGTLREAIVYLDPKKTQEFNLSPLQVIDKLTKLNTFVPTGDVKIGTDDYQIVSNALADRVQDITDFPLRGQNGVPVFVRDIGRAEDSHQIQTNVVTIDGKEEVYVPIYRQPGANTIQVVDRVKDAIKTLSLRLPDFKLTLVADQTGFVRHAISSIAEEAMIGGGLAILTVLLGLGSLKATYGILIALPLSLLFPFIGFNFSGQTINAMTLGGIAISIGVVVDNSIVMLENISRKLESGESALEAALRAGAEVAMPVLASTLSTLVVLFPVMFLSGIVKVLFAALAKSVMFIMVGSYLAAMVLIPLYASRFMTGSNAESIPRVLGLISSRVNRLVPLYEIALKSAMKHSRLVFGGIFALFLIAALLAPHIGTELFPVADSGGFVLTLRLRTGLRIEETEKFTRTMDRKLRQWIAPGDLHMIIANAGVYYGFPAAYTPNTGPQDVFFDVELTEDRQHTSQYYAKRIRERLRAEFPDVEAGMELGGLLSSAINAGLRSPIDIQIEGPNLKTAVETAGALAAEMKNLKGAVDVRVQQRLDAPAISLNVDRDKAMNLGLTVDDVVKNVVSAVAGSSTFNPAIWVDPKTGIDYFFGVQFPEKRVSTMQELADIPIRSQFAIRSLPLKSVARISTTTAPSEIDEVNLRTVVDIFMSAQDRDIGGLSRDVQKVVNGWKFPAGYRASIRGEIAEMKRSIGSLGGGFALSALLVYLILVAQFESFRLPVVIMVTVPLGMIGIVFMLFLTGTYFSIQAAIGAIFMIGIAVSNGVLLVEFIRKRHRETGKLEASILEGAKARVRPILMTATASICGLLPMAIGFGHGSEANIPLGRAIIGGLLISTLLTLFVVPMIYRMTAKRALISPEIKSAA